MQSVVVLHGWGHSGQIWKDLAEKFGKKAKSPDLPGFGHEPLVSPSWGIPEYAQWLERKINKKEKVVLVGHSFGGRVAVEIASKNPKWLAGLVLSGAPCIYRPSLKIRIKIKIYKIFKIFLPKNLRRFFYSDDLAEANKRGLEKIFRKVINYDQTQALKKIKIPVILIWG